MAPVLYAKTCREHASQLLRAAVVAIPPTLEHAPVWTAGNWSGG